MGCRGWFCWHDGVEDLVDVVVGVDGVNVIFVERASLFEGGRGWVVGSCAALVESGGEYFLGDLIPDVDVGLARREPFFLGGI